jgi:hypothetical protein
MNALRETAFAYPGDQRSGSNTCGVACNAVVVQRVQEKKHVTSARNAMPPELDFDDRPGRQEPRARVHAQGVGDTLVRIRELLQIIRAGGPPSQHFVDLG